MRSGLSAYYVEDVLMPVTEMDRKRELAAYRGLRYTGASFESVERNPRTSRVVHNGEYRLYHVNAT